MKITREGLLQLYKRKGMQFLIYGVWAQGEGAIWRYNRDAQPVLMNSEVFTPPHCCLLHIQA